MQALGEDLEAPQLYDKGRAPVKLPLAVRVGSLACIEHGETPMHAIDKRLLVDGIPPACFAPLAIDVIAETSTLNRCALQRLYSAIIWYEYADDEAQIRAIFDAWLPGVLNVHYVPATESLPTIVVAYNALVCVVILDGTRNYETYAWQAFNLIIEPQDVGAFGTLRFWYDSATYVNGIIGSLGIGATVPMMLVGHSYGGAVAMILAARYRLESAERVIRCMTFGAPKPGDARLRRLLDTCEVLTIANANDFTPLAPPDYPSVVPLLPFLGSIRMLSWNQWDKAPSVYLQADNGALLPDAYPNWDFPTLLEFAGRALTSRPQSPVAGHPILEYYRRATLRCPAPQWPSNQQAGNLLNIATTQLTLSRPEIAAGRLNLVGWNDTFNVPGKGAIALNGQLDQVPVPADGKLELFGHQPYNPARADGAIAWNGGFPPLSLPAIGKLRFAGGVVRPPETAAGYVKLLGEAPAQKAPALGALYLGGGPTVPELPAGGAVELLGGGVAPPAAAGGRVEWTSATRVPSFPADGVLVFTTGADLAPAPATGAIGFVNGSQKVTSIQQAKLLFNAMTPVAAWATGALRLGSCEVGTPLGLSSGGYSIALGSITFIRYASSGGGGATCNTATKAVNAVPNDFQLFGNDEKWFRIKLPAGVELQVTATLLGGDDNYVNIYTGSSCAVIVGAGGTPFNSVPQLITSSTETWCYAQAFAAPGTSGTYRLILEYS